jgi:hypothetical protein
MKKILTIILVVIILAAAGAVTWLFMSGRLAWVDPNTKAVTVKAVCGTDIVNKYNDASVFIARNGSSERTVDEEGLKSLKTTIVGKDGYKDDPTCQAMLFWISFRNKDYEGAKAAYTAVRALHDKGLFADSNLRSNDALFTYEDVLFTISPDAGKSTKALGG